MSATPIMMRWLQHCPGGLGILLRQKLYPRYFKACGRKVIFGYGVKIQHPKHISVGDGVCFSDFSMVEGGEGSGITLGTKVFVGVGSRLVSRGGLLKVGEGSNIGSFCTIQAEHDVLLEKETLLAAYGVIGGEGQGEDTVLGAGAWLGARVVVSSGTRIGHDAIIGAHALVENDIDDWAIAVGRPAEVKRLRSTE